MFRTTLGFGSVDAYAAAAQLVAWVSCYLVRVAAPLPKLSRAGREGSEMKHNQGLELTTRMWTRNARSSTGKHADGEAERLRCDL